MSGGSRLVAVVAGSASKAHGPCCSAWQICRLQTLAPAVGRNASRSCRCAGRARCSRALLPLPGRWLRQSPPTRHGPCHHRTGAPPFHRHRRPGADARNHRVRSNIDTSGHISTDSIRYKRRRMFQAGQNWPTATYPGQIASIAWSGSSFAKKLRVEYTKLFSKQWPCGICSVHNKCQRAFGLAACANGTRTPMASGI